MPISNSDHHLKYGLDLVCNSDAIRLTDHLRIELILSGP